MRELDWEVQVSLERIPIDELMHKRGVERVMQAFFEIDKARTESFAQLTHRRTVDFDSLRAHGMALPSE
eukprot:696625-Lingulodinium_polyedra.AAC.1